VCFWSCPPGCVCFCSSGRPLPKGTTIRVNRARFVTLSIRHTQRCWVSVAHPVHTRSPTTLPRFMPALIRIPCVHRDSGRILWTGRVSGCLARPNGPCSGSAAACCAGVPLGWTRGPHRPEHSGELGGRVPSGSQSARWRRPVRGLWVAIVPLTRASLDRCVGSHLNGAAFSHVARAMRLVPRAAACASDCDGS
jgi:hypothetical protein